MDKSYWTKFYAKHKVGKKPSLFAQFVWENYLRGNTKSNTKNNAQILHLLELGCGNGRDSLYFAKNGIKVLGIDQCENVIDSLNKKHKSDNLIFQSADFTALPKATKSYDAIYSRFTLHSINATQQSHLFKWVGANLAQGGILAIECRGHKNSLYKLGEMVEMDAFIYENHYRRFVRFESLLEILGDDYEILFAKEDKGFAPFREEDDYFCRLIAIYRGGGQTPKYLIIFAINLDSGYLRDKGASYVA